MLSDKYWNWYIFIKHGSEIIVLLSQLIISTAMKSYDTPRLLSANNPSNSSLSRMNKR